MSLALPLATLDGVLQNVVDALSIGSLYALFALGIALIFGIMRLINFAHGELIMVGAYTVVFLDGVPWPALIMATLGVVVVVALLMERAAFRPVRGASPATLLITSFAVSYLLQNLAILFIGSTPRAADISPVVVEAVDVGGLSISKLDMLTVGVTVVLLGSLAAFLTRTRAGVQMRAAAEDFRMARLLGVNANRVIAVAFAISGLLAGVGALLLVAETGNVAPTIGLTPVLIAFVATVVGGMASLTGAVLGGYLFGAITVALQVALPLELRSYRDAFAYLAVILVLLARPNGLIVARAAETRV